MNSVWVKLTRLIVYSSMIMVFISVGAWGAEIYIPALKAKAGESVDIPVMIDEVDNLAGVKLVIKYDADILEFKKADKTRHTSPLMHIINAKNPGTLVVVMAGARGVKGKDFPILSLKFDVKNPLKNKNTTRLDITEVQLMSDQLKNIPYNIKINDLELLTGSPDIKPASATAEIKISEPDVKASEPSAEKSEPTVKKTEQPDSIPERSMEKPKCTMEQIFSQ